MARTGLLPLTEEWPEFPRGLVWLVGAGPGDPGLLTLHGLNALQQADHVVYDALANREILGWCRSDVVAEFAGKRGGRPSPTQQNITIRLIELARQGKRVLRLKGGDPFVFGRGGEEAIALLKAGIPLRITPGITAGIGGLAYAGIPLTHRDFNQSVTFLTGHDDRGHSPTALDWDALARGGQVIVLYMASRKLTAIAARLIAAGRNRKETVAIISKATLAQQAVLMTRLDRCGKDLAASDLRPPTIVCIGDIANLRQSIGELASISLARDS